MAWQGILYPVREDSHVASLNVTELGNCCEEDICENEIHEDNKQQVDSHSLEVRQNTESRKVMVMVQRRVMVPKINKALDFLKLIECS